MPKRSSEIYKGQRNKEKRALFVHFRIRVIQDAVRARFFQLFKNRCFKCGRNEKIEPEFGKPPVLCIDHHIPMARGGHLVPGNLVSLCRDCNHRKLDTDPNNFYTIEELQKLSPLLDSQKELFTFFFDEDRWMNDRENYLLETGVPRTTVQADLNDENNLHYVGYPAKSSNTCIKINIDVTEYLDSSARSGDSY